MIEPAALVALDADDVTGIERAALALLWLPGGETGEIMPEGPPWPKDCDSGYALEGADEAAPMNDDPTGEDRPIMDEERECPAPPL